MFHVNSYFAIVLLMGNVETVSDLDFSAVIAANSKKCTNDSFLSLISAKVMVEDREENDRINDTSEWSECRCP
jgi:hypothetical protein